MLTAMAAVRGGDLGTLTADLSRETGRRKLEEKKNSGKWIRPQRPRGRGFYRRSGGDGVQVQDKSA